MPLHLYWHPSSLQHDTGAGHPEAPARVRAILDALEGWPSSDVTLVEANPSSDEQILLAHTPSHLQRLVELDAHGGGWIDGDTVMSAESLSAARHAAGAAVAAARSALEGVPAFAAVRPPGHHATTDRAMGFCLLNSVAIAALTVLDDPGVNRVLIVDWDVHHGNGTQEILETEERVRYVSLHQWPLYPGTGRAEERGVGNVFNVPRPPGLPRSEYRESLLQAVSRAVDGWQPELLLISAGFDAMAGDPLAGFTLEPDDFAHWTSAWRELAPIASVLEGGYVPARIAAAATHHLRALLA